MLFQHRQGAAFDGGRKWLVKLLPALQGNLARWLVFEVLAVRLYYVVRHGFFQAEDFLWLNISGWRSVLASFYSPWGHGPAYRPIIRVSYWIDDLIFARMAAGWHFTNVALHAAAAAMLAHVLERAGLRRITSTAAALLFLCAPLEEESVAFISGRTGVIGLLFMLLALNSWITALTFRRRRAVASAAAFSVLGALSYEAGFILPALLILPLIVQAPRTREARRFAAFGFAVIVLALAAVLAFRAYVLRGLTEPIDPFHPDLVTAISRNSVTIAEQFQTNWGSVALVCLGLALLVSLADRRLRRLAAVLVLAAILLYLPYLMIDGVAGRFLYMSMAPLCALLVLPLELPPRLGALVGAGALLLLVLPGFVRGAQQGAATTIAAGLLAERVLFNVVDDIPRDGRTNVIDGIPAEKDYRPTFGGYFELATLEFAKPPIPWMAHTEALEAVEIVAVLGHVMSMDTNYWVLDPVSLHLQPITKRTWITRHLEAVASLAALGPRAVTAALREPEACALADTAGVGTAEPSAPDIAATADGAGLTIGPAGADFAVSATNVGSAAALSVAACGETAALPFGIAVCPSDAGTGACLSPPAPSITLPFPPGQTRNVKVFLRPAGGDPAGSAVDRIFVLFKTADGTLGGSAVVSVTAGPPRAE